MNDQNGTPQQKQLEVADLKKWALCYLDQNGGLLGPVETVTGDNAHTPDVVVLGNAYVFAAGHRFLFGSVQPGGPAQPVLLADVFQVAPFEFLSAEVRLAVRPVLFFPLAGLAEGSPADFQNLGAKIIAGIARAQQERLQVRAQKSGIALAGAGARLPPGPGRLG